jgi:hypothetical protein
VNHFIENIFDMIFLKMDREYQGKGSSQETPDLYRGRSKRNATLASSR